MLPVVDYGSIALVIPQVSAIGAVIDEGDKHGFEVFLEGVREPIVVGFEDHEEAEEARNELVAIVAQYYYTTEMGPDFDLEEFLEVDDDEEEDDDDEPREH